MHIRKEGTPRISISEPRPKSVLEQLVGPATLVLLIALQTAACGQRYRGPIFSQAQVSTDIAYGELEAHRLDVYQPAGDTEVDRLAILLIHGGGFSGGDKQLDLYVEMATEFAKRGYVAFSINYRLGNPGSNPAVPDTAVADARRALDWIRASRSDYGIDPDKISIGGDSAGGFIVVNLCYRNAAAAGAAACLDLWGGAYEAGRFRGPIYPHPIGPDTPPTLILHGDADTVVPYQTSLDLADQLEAAGIGHELHTLEGANHYPTELSTEFIAIMADFVYRRVWEVASAVADPEDAASVPTRYVLEQNYPNPYNSGTTIRFALPTRAATALAVYNLAGQHVASVARGVREAGTYTLQWDGRDDHGRRLASGTYLYRLQAPGHVETRKLTLLK